MKPDVELEIVARCAALQAAGKSIAEISAATGIAPKKLAAAAKAWHVVFETDSKAHAEYSARVLLGSAEHARALDEPRPASRIRAICCPRCGAYKQTEPRTAYVYCDHCGGLFEYEVDRHVSSRSVFETITNGVREELHSSFQQADWTRYRAAWRWCYELDIRLAPHGWSPRIADPVYREAMIEYSIETCVAQNRREPSERVALERSNAAFAAIDLFTQFPQLGNVRDAMLAWLDANDLALDEELALHQRLGIFDKHPDALDPPTYKRINVVLAALAWAGRVPGALLDEVFDKTGIRTTSVDVPRSALAKQTCGCCGGKLLVIDAARAIVCEACGRRLELDARPFSCPSCGAGLVATPASASTRCAWCLTRIDVSR